MLDVVSRVLEESVFSPARPSVFTDPHTAASPALVQHLQMLRILLEAQDQLERKYMCKKEEHRALEMQKYMGINRNIGNFDPDRLVEGGIFRLGMLLEEIKEMIDNNVRQQISPFQAPSPTPSFNIQSPSPLSLHQDQSSSVSTGASEIGDTTAMRRADKMTEHTKNTEVCISRSLHTFQNAWTSSVEDKEQQNEDTVFTKGVGDSNIHASYNVIDVSPEECPAVTSTSEASKACDIAPKSLLKTSVSQGNIIPETDSGFGSSYLNHSGSGSIRQSLNESFASQKEPVSSSGSEGSCSNLRTAIEPVTKAQRSPRRSELSSASNSVQQWVESTTKDTVFPEQGHKQNMSESISAPTLGRMDTRGSPMQTCSCNK
uniref:Uncharacterized protein n=1 Tax=Knipowitschia caucasica TaxID=637954 RepID=A0AAV2JQ01_KNICA